MDDKFGWLGGLIGIVMAALVFWGIGWSFYRHGTGHGLMAFFIPPYAVYRGVAYLWEDPVWKEHWDEKTEMLGTIISMANAKEKPLEFIRYKDHIRKWIKTIPKDDREDLENATNSFGDAIIQYSRNIMEDITSSSDIRSITDPSIQIFTERFDSVSGFKTVWKQIANQDKTMRKAFEKIMNEAPPENRLHLPVYGKHGLKRKAMMNLFTNPARLSPQGPAIAFVNFITVCR